jgi:predicted PurR-regulated permease PerM
LASGLRPLVEVLHDKGVPRLLSILIIYLIFIFFLGFILYLSGVVLAEQVEHLSENAGSIFADSLVKLIELFPWVLDVFGIKDYAAVRESALNLYDANLKAFLTGSLLTRTTGEALISTISNIATFIIGIFTVLALSAYMLHSEGRFYQGILQPFSKKKQDYIHTVINKVEEKLGSWLIGQFILMIAIGLSTYFGLLIPGLIFPDSTFMQYIIPLALIAALFEVVPNIGPLITWIIASIITIGSGGSFLEVTYITILFVVVQQIENTLLVPVVMKKAVGIDPIIIILGLIAASTLFGIIGAILVLPIIATSQIILDEIINNGVTKDAV